MVRLSDRCSRHVRPVHELLKLVTLGGLHNTGTIGDICEMVTLGGLHNARTIDVNLVTPGGLYNARTIGDM